MERDLVLQKDNKPKISIIVPVYNAEKTIEHTLKALIDQSYKNWEALIVDNNSSDDSAMIIKKYSNIDSRIKYFFEKEKGPATARNLGLEVATGEFVMFCDADDWYSENMCEIMLDTIIQQNVDLVTTEPNIIYQEGARANSDGDLVYHKLNNYGKFDISLNTHHYLKDTLWNKIFKRHLIEKFKIRFFNGSLFDDAFFVLCYSMVCKNFYCLDKKLYNYVFSVSGITYNIHHHKYKPNHLATGISAGIRFISDNNITNKEKVNIVLTKTKDILSYPVSYMYKDADLVEMFDVLRLEFNGIDKNLLVNMPQLYAIAQGEYNFAASCFGRFNEKRGNSLFSRNFKKWGLNDYIKIFNISILKKMYRIDGVTYKLFGKINVYKKNLKSKISQNKQNDMHIFFAADNSYIKPLCVAINSLLRHANRNDKINIYVINDGISFVNKILIYFLLKNLNQKIEFIEIDDSLFKDFPTMGYFKKQNYYRFLIPKLKPELSKALYLDSDICVKKDLSELWNVDLGDNYIGAVSDFGALMEVCQKDISTKKNVVSFDGSYVNSGVLLLNLDLWKRNDITSKLIDDTIKIQDKILFVDQCVINYTLKDKIKYLDLKYNLQTHGQYLVKEDLKRQYYIEKNYPAIIHYTCSAKPFIPSENCEHELWKEWFKEVNKTFFTKKKYPLYIEKLPDNRWKLYVCTVPLISKDEVPYVPSANFFRVKRYKFLGLKYKTSPTKAQITNILFECMWYVKKELSEQININKE